MLTIRISRQFYKIQKYYSNVIKYIPGNNVWKQSIYLVHTENKFKPKFSNMIEHRRKQAACSIIVQVNSANSYNELYSYCNQFGKIKNMCHYTTSSEPMHFILVEFGNEKSVNEIISSSCHIMDYDNAPIPVTSQFLWFRALGNKNKKRLSSTTTSSLPPFIENGTKILNENEIQQILSNANNISDQMILLHKNTCLSETGNRIRYLACRQIEHSLSGMFPNCQALPFGSSVNSFGKEGCDLDIVLRLNNNQKQTDQSRLAFHSKAGLTNGRSQTQRHMECIADILQLFLPGCLNVRRILQARVPIIKYFQEQTGLECDLSMTNMTGVYMSDLLYTLSCVDDRVQPLMFTIRRWAQQTGLTTNSPGRWITNFSLTLMVLFFLQKVQILPAVNTLMKLAESTDQIVTDDGINCSFLHDLNKLTTTQTANTDSLDILLLQFFEMFSTFDFYVHAISLNEAKCVHKPDNGALYIVNPLECHYNVSKNVSIEELERLKIECRNAAWLLESQDNTKYKIGTQWGLLELLKTKSVPKVKLFNFNTNIQQQQQHRLVEVKRLFDDENNKESTVYKNEQIKTETAAELKKIDKNLLKKEQARVRIRRR